MAITTLNGAAAGSRPACPIAKSITPTLVAGRPHSLWYLAGQPGAGSMDSTTSGGVALSSSSALVPGQLPHYDPGAGLSYLHRLSANVGQAGVLVLCDRLWHGSDIIGGSVISVTSTSLQTITAFPGLPARDNSNSSNGDGVLFGLEVYNTLGAGTPTATLTYHNQANTGSRIATNLDAVVASSAVGSFYRFGLQGNDTGIRTPDSIQLSATMTTGNVGLVAYRELARLELSAAGVPNAIDWVTGGSQKIPNGAVPFLIFIPSTTTAVSVGGSYIETQG